VIDGPAKDHEPCGITRDDLRQNSCRRRYLISAFVGLDALRGFLILVAFLFDRRAYSLPGLYRCHAVSRWELIKGRLTSVRVF